MSTFDGWRNRIVCAGAERTWQTLPDLPLPATAAVLVDNGLQALAAVRTHATHGTELLVVAASRVDAAMRDELRAAGLAIVGWAAGEVTEDPGTERAPEPGRLWLLTSGSTGRPKRIGHTLGSLTTVRGEQVPRTWLCPYSPGTYAWWQVVTLCLTQPGQDLVTVEPHELETWPRIAAEHGVTAASGTPTFWRQTIYRDTEALSKVALEQITLGGEPVDQAILDRLRDLFPAARISWIYASSEVGASIVVHDGRAGFPSAWLDRVAPGRPTLSVSGSASGNELIITSPFHGAGLGGAVRTGDRVEIVDDRVMITGRLDSDEINVGGSKISAGLVRDVLQEHPAVAWARVAARRAPIVGHVVVADVVLSAGADEIDDADLVAWCSARLPDYAVPRRIRFQAEIQAKETLKSDV
jgi:acyl-CoA synthetase (AMP-forming)/AMP-acid ligase II